MYSVSALNRLLAVKRLSDPLDVSKVETSLVIAKVLSIALNLPR